MLRNCFTDLITANLTLHEYTCNSKCGAVDVVVFVLLRRFIAIFTRFFLNSRFLNSRFSEFVLRGGIISHYDRDVLTYYYEPFHILNSGEGSGIVP